MNQMDPLEMLALKFHRLRCDPTCEFVPRSDEQSWADAEAAIADGSLPAALGSLAAQGVAAEPVTVDDLWAALANQPES